MTDTSPAALHKLADLLDYEYGTEDVVKLLRAIAAEKEAQAKQASPDERHLRRLLALRTAIPGTYFDDGEASGSQHGISIDFMREPVADIDAKLRALNVARMECSKPEQHHPEQPLNMVAPADVPLPEPYDHIHEWDTPLYVERDLDSAPKNGRPPNRSIPVFTTKQFVLGRSAYAEAYAKAKVAAERERCAQAAQEYLTRMRSPFGMAVADAIRAAKKGTV